MLGMAIKLNLVTPPPNANPALLKQPRKVVPNARATPALQFQPHFEDAVSATQHELTMDVQIHPPVDTPPASPSSYQTLASPPSIISQQPLQQVPPTRKTRSNRAGKKPGPSSQQVLPPTKTTKSNLGARNPTALPSSSHLPPSADWVTPIVCLGNHSRMVNGRRCERANKLRIFVQRIAAMRIMRAKFWSVAGSTARHWRERRSSILVTAK